MIKTKIVATLGPATDTIEQISDLIQSGMNVARLNFSHSNHICHKKRLEKVRKISKAQNKSVSILQDLQGPKIRTGKLKGSKPIMLIPGQELVITTNPCLGDQNLISTTYQNLTRDVTSGDRILLSDGTIELKVKKVIEDKVICKVISGEILQESQGLNIPGVTVSAPSISSKDIKDLKFGIKHKVDYIAQSFVSSAKDIKSLKDIMRQFKADIPIIAKLERQEALDDLDNILDVADGIMIARGDLGVEIPPEKLPLAQKEIIRRANQASIPVITATQMLDSMIYNSRPTRAEVTDVANAILDGTDAIMLSGETATGKYPTKSVQMMAKIAAQVEENSEDLIVSHHLNFEFQETSSKPSAIGAAVSTITHSLPIKAILVHTLSGSTARLIARYKPKVPIIAFTPNQEVYQRLSLLWGVIPHKIKYFKTYRALEKQMYPALKQRKLVKNQDLVVITGGHPIEGCYPTNYLKIDTINY